MADKRWIGAALDINDKWTITVAGVWAAADTVTISVGNSSMTVTIGTLITTGDVANAINAAINAVNSTDALIGDESRNVGGRQMPELTGIDSTVASSVVTLTNSIAGVPFVLVVTEATVGTGTATEANSQVATGKHFLANAANWDGGTLPITNDKLVFDNGGISCLYGLGYMRDNTLDFSVTVTTDFTGRIGRPSVTSLGFIDYITPRFLQMYDATPATTLKFVLGERKGAGPLPCYIDGEGTTVSVSAIDMGQANSGEPDLTIDGGTIGLTLVKGHCVIDPQAGESTTATILSNSTVGAAGLDNSKTSLVVNENTDFVDANRTCQVYSGIVDFFCPTINGVNKLAVTCWGGNTWLHNTSGSHDLVVNSGGKAFLKSGTYSSVVNYGLVDCNQDAQTKIITSLTLYPDSSFFDLSNTATLTAVSIVGRLDQVKIQGNLGL